VSNAARIGETAKVAFTVYRPDAATLRARPIVSFAKAGGGYSRGYGTVDPLGPAKGLQSSGISAGARRR
jgi:hypothetical protein